MTFKLSSKPSKKDWPPLNEVLVDAKAKKSYQLGAFLGEGEFAICYEVLDMDCNEKRCCKSIWKRAIKDTFQKEKIRSEIQISSILRHEKIVTLYSCFEDKNYVYIILELCDKQSMQELLYRRKQLTEEEARYYLIQILDAMEYCLSKKVIHRDLKLGNIFLSSDMTIRIGDFGFAAELKTLDERKNTLIGTPDYIAPEILDENIGHSFEADIWAIGIILYTLIIGTPPFQTWSKKKIYSKIRAGNYQFPSRKLISPQAKDLITTILTNDPDKRPNFSEIRKHPFFRDGFTPTTLPVSALLSKPTFVRLTGSPRSSMIEPDPETDKILDMLKDFNLSHSDKENEDSQETHVEVALLDTEKILTKLSHEFSLKQTQSTKTSTATSIKSDVSFREELDCKDELSFSNMGELGPVHSSKYPKADETLIFEEIIKTFENAFLFAESQTMEEPQRELHGINMSVPNFISKWVDRGDQYGLGFELIDSSSGVFFKDSTTLIEAFDNKHYEYVYSKKENKKEFHCEVYLSNTFPETLQKKLLALKKYSKQMSKTLSSAVASSFKAECLPNYLLNPTSYSYPTSQSTILPYITKFLQTRRATLFRLSNRIVQMNFKYTHLKLILSENGQVVTVISSSGYLETHSLTDIVKKFKQSGKKFKERKASIPGNTIQEDNSSSPLLNEKVNITPSQKSVPIEQIYEHLEYLKEVLKHVVSKKQKTLTYTK